MAEATEKRGSLARAALAFGALFAGSSLLRRDTEPVPARVRTGLQGRGPDPQRRTDGAGRGRDANVPTEIPAKGWMDILWRVWAQIGEDRLLTEAAGVAFYAILALVPTLAAFVSLYGLVSDPADIGAHLESMRGVLPEGVLSLVGDQLTRIASQESQTLGLAFGVSLALSLWSANAATKAMFDALNVIYEEKEKRGFLRLNLTALAFTLGGMVFAIVALGAVVVLPIVLGYVGLGALADTLLRVLRWPLLLAVVVAALGLLYRYGPSRSPAQWRWVTPGGIFAAIVWLVVSIGFSYYVQNFGDYNETYGSLGAVIAFMTWIWLSSAVVLLGAELNSEIEHQTVEDTTDAPEKPLGSRGATMADTIGAARG